MKEKMGEEEEEREREKGERERCGERGRDEDGGLRMEPVSVLVVDTVRWGW